MKEKLKLNIDENDPADDMMVITNRLYALAEEQQDKGNMAMYYILDDLCKKINNVVSKARNKNRRVKENR